MANDHINTIERKLIDNLRNGTYSTIAGVDSGSAWATTDVTVFGQFPEPEDIKYPCIVVEMTANGIEEQFTGQKVTSGSSKAIGELYGVGYRIHLAVEKESAITVVWDNATCDTNSNTTVTMDNTSLVTIGATVSGSGIPAGATVSSITNSTTIVISAAATTSLTNTTLTFSAAYKQRRLLNYLMLNCADVLMDCDFSSTDVQVTNRQYTGFTGVGYNQQLETWFSSAGMVLVFLNTR